MLDATGAEIRYGQRWGDDGPPDDQYSLDLHPERFAPLHVIADALAGYLADTFEVEASPVRDLASLDAGGMQVLRATRLRPAGTDHAAMTLAWTGYPGVTVESGLRYRGIFPICGCEACDEPWETVAADLERHVLAVADGRLQESVDAERGWAEWTQTEPGGLWSTAASEQGLPVEHLRAAEATLGALPDGWRPWRRRR